MYPGRGSGRTRWSDLNDRGGGVGDRIEGHFCSREIHSTSHIGGGRSQGLRVGMGA